MRSITAIAAVIFFHSLGYGFDIYDKDLESKQLPANNEPLFVSLGSTCEIAHALRYFCLRTGAFPFDWMLTIDNSGLLVALEEDFLHFTDSRYLERDPTGILLNIYYRMAFLHEGDWNVEPYQESLQKLQSKHQRRIARFNNISSYCGKVLFFRSAVSWANCSTLHFPDEGNVKISDQWTLKLYNVLKNRFPGLDFHLIIINEHDELKPIIRKLCNNITIITANLNLTPIPKMDNYQSILVSLLESFGLSDTAAYQKLKNYDSSSASSRY